MEPLRKFVAVGATAALIGAMGACAKGVINNATPPQRRSWY